MKLWTLGHSTRSSQEFLEILRAHGIKRVVDVRTIPRSRHNPQFNRESLGLFLRGRGIGYRHMKSLGGLRKPRPDSPNKGWLNASFRGYADYMQTPDFEEGLSALMVFAKEKPTAILCAEAVPWRCHRSLIADAATARGVSVFNIMGTGPAKPHTLNPMAEVRGKRLYYPGKALELPLKS